MSKPTTPADILVVDDTPANLKLLTAMLKQSGYQVRSAINGRLALNSAQESPPDLVLLDINMPEMNGYDVCRALKQAAALRDVPVIFISALHETGSILQAFQVGGVDYVTKPFQIGEVLARVETHLTLARQRQEIAQLREEDRLYYEQITRLKDQVMMTASHDLKNPLGAIGAYVELIQQDMPELVQAHPLLADYLEGIRTGADRMMTLITDLLDLAQIETGINFQREPVPLVGFLERALKDVDLLSKVKHTTLVFGGAPDLLLPIDPKRMHQVLTNLLSNAIKYTPEGGRIELRARYDSGEVIIQVEDNGLGIPAEYIPQLFEPFFRVPEHKHLEAASGTGLGLSIVKGIVDNHAGRVLVQSTPGQGTVFSVHLPAELPEGPPD